MPVPRNSSRIVGQPAGARDSVVLALATSGGASRTTVSSSNHSPSPSGWWPRYMTLWPGSTGARDNGPQLPDRGTDGSVTAARSPSSDPTTQPAPRSATVRKPAGSGSGAVVCGAITRGAGWPAAFARTAVARLTRKSSPGSAFSTRVSAVDTNRSRTSAPTTGTTSRVPAVWSVVEGGNRRNQVAGNEPDASRWSSSPPAPPHWKTATS